MTTAIKRLEAILFGLDDSPALVKSLPPIYHPELGQLPDDHPWVTGQTHDDHPANSNHPSNSFLFRRVGHSSAQQMIHHLTDANVAGVLRSDEMFTGVDPEWYNSHQNGTTTHEILGDMHAGHGKAMADLHEEHQNWLREREAAARPPKGRDTWQRSAGLFVNPEDLIIQEDGTLALKDADAPTSPAPLSAANAPEALSVTGRAKPPDRDKWRPGRPYRPYAAGRLWLPSDHPWVEGASDPTHAAHVEHTVNPHLFHEDGQFRTPDEMSALPAHLQAVGHYWINRLRDEHEIWQAERASRLAAHAVNEDHGPGYGGSDPAHARIPYEHHPDWEAFVAARSPKLRPSPAPPMMEAGSEPWSVVRGSWIVEEQKAMPRFFDDGVSLPKDHPWRTPSRDSVAHPDHPRHGEFFDHGGKLTELMYFDHGPESTALRNQHNDYSGGIRTASGPAAIKPDGTVARSYGDLSIKALPPIYHPELGRLPDDHPWVQGQADPAHPAHPDHPSHSELFPGNWFAAGKTARIGRDDWEAIHPMTDDQAADINEHHNARPSSVARPVPILEYDDEGGHDTHKDRVELHEEHENWLREQQPHRFWHHSFAPTTAKATPTRFRDGTPVPDDHPWRAAPVGHPAHPDHPLHDRFFMPNGVQRTRHQEGDDPEEIIGHFMTLMNEHAGYYHGAPDSDYPNIHEPTRHSAAGRDRDDGSEWDKLNKAIDAEDFPLDIKQAIFDHTGCVLGSDHPWLSAPETHPANPDHPDHDVLFSRMGQFREPAQVNLDDADHARLMESYKTLLDEHEAHMAGQQPLTAVDSRQKETGDAVADAVKGIPGFPGLTGNAPRTDDRGGGPHGYHRQGEPTVPQKILGTERLDFQHPWMNPDRDSAAHPDHPLYGTFFGSNHVFRYPSGMDNYSDGHPIAEAFRRLSVDHDKHETERTGGSDANRLTGTGFYHY